MKQQQKPFIEFNGERKEKKRREELKNKIQLQWKFFSARLSAFYDVIYHFLWASREHVCFHCLPNSRPIFIIVLPFHTHHYRHDIEINVRFTPPMALFYITLDRSKKKFSHSRCFFYWQTFAFFLAATCKFGSAKESFKYLSFLMYFQSFFFVFEYCREWKKRKERWHDFAIFLGKHVF